MDRDGSRTALYPTVHGAFLLFGHMREPDRLPALAAGLAERACAIRVLHALRRLAVAVAEQVECNPLKD